MPSAVRTAWSSWLETWVIVPEVNVFSGFAELEVNAPNEYPATTRASSSSASASSRIRVCRISHPNRSAALGGSGVRGHGGVPHSRVPPR